MNLTSEFTLSTDIISKLGEGASIRCVEAKTASFIRDKVYKVERRNYILGVVCEHGLFYRDSSSSFFVHHLQPFPETSTIFYQLESVKSISDIATGEFFTWGSCTTAFCKNGESSYFLASDGTAHKRHHRDAHIFGDEKMLSSNLDVSLVTLTANAEFTSLEDYV